MNLSVSPQLIIPLLAILGCLVALTFWGRVPIAYNIRNLIVRWPMTALTGFAFTVVIALLTAMLAFVNGMSKLTDDSGHPENVIVLADGSTDESFSTLNFTDSSDLDQQPGIVTGAAGKPLCSREVYLIASQHVAPESGSGGSSARGQIKRVVAAENRLILVDDKGDETPYQLGAKASVTINNEPSQLDFMKPGDLVWLSYEQSGAERVISDLRASNQRRFVQIRGVEDPLIAAEVHGLELSSGNWFGDEGVEGLPATGDQVPETAVQVVLGEGAARALAPDLNKETLVVGDIFLLGPKKWKVVGILKASGTIFGSEVWAKRSYVGDLYGKPSVVSSITIRSDSPGAAKTLVETLKNYKQANLAPQTETEYYSKQRTFLLIIQTAIIILTAFMALGGVFGVMNTMFAMISQRSKDIGVLRIIGYARWQILVSFLLESMGIALLGGLLGCALGSAAHGFNMTSVVGAGQGFGKTVALKLTVTPNTILIGVLLTMSMGLVGGLLPAISAMRVRPLESLR